MSRSALLGVSLATNAVLAGVALWLAAERTSPLPPASSSPLPPPAANSSPTLLAAVASEESPLPAAAAESPVDFADWVRRSRAAGVSECVLVGLVATEFGERWSERERDFERRYWRGYESDATRLRFEQQREQALEDAIRAALGDEAFEAWDQQRILRTQHLENVQLSPVEARALYRLHKHWAQRNRALQHQRAAGEIDDAAFSREFAAAQTQFEESQRTLLGDERYAAMQQPADSSYIELRRSLGGQSVSDRQFDALLRSVSFPEP